MYQFTISRKPIEPTILRKLSNIDPYQSLAILFTEWLLIVSAIAMHLYFHNPAVYFVVWIIIGTRMYALYSLLHDGLHYLLFPQRQFNDMLCRLFLAWPLFISFAKMRRAHLAHHKYLKTPEDPEAVHTNYPEFTFPQPKGKLAFTFLKDICGYNFIFYRLKKMYALIQDKSPATDSTTSAVNRNNTIGSIIYYASIFLLTLYMGWASYFIIYWLIPYITIYQALNRIRLSAEHFNLDEEDKFLTRTMKLNTLERFFMSPHNLGYHTEHHLYPSVPFYRLAELHQILMKDAEYSRNATIQTSYLHLIKKYITT